MTLFVYGDTNEPSTYFITKHKSYALDVIRGKIHVERHRTSRDMHFIKHCISIEPEKKKSGDWCKQLAFAWVTWRSTLKNIDEISNSNNKTTFSRPNQIRYFIGNLSTSTVWILIWNFRLHSFKCDDICCSLFYTLIKSCICLIIHEISATHYKIRAKFDAS